MSTSSPRQLSVEIALAKVPATFRNRLVKYYQSLKEAFLRGEFDACGSRAGKFSETLIRCLQNTLEGKYTPFGKQINLYDESRRLERLPAASGPESFRVFIPRALCFLYTMRNKRGFAHVGGDLDSDPVDAATCVRVADWCLCELIRIVHELSLEDAQSLVNTIASREAPDVWSVAGKRRVLRTDLNFKEQSLLLLYSGVKESVLIEDLYEWVEYSRFSDFKSKILSPLHKARLIEWDEDTDSVLLSPTGEALVEEKILNIPGIC
jgi:hypothetical protein